jgi:hypothetical protein
MGTQVRLRSRAGCPRERSRPIREELVRVNNLILGLDKSEFYLIGGSENAAVATMPCATFSSISCEVIRFLRK